MEKESKDLVKKEKRKIGVKDYIFFGILAVGLIFFMLSKLLPADDKNSEQEMAKVKIGDATTLVVAVADTHEERYQGLSGVEGLKENRAMLFVHGYAGQPGYVMRGMKIDLDFIFIGDGRVVDVARNVAHEFDGEVKGAAPYDKVLEVSAGWAQVNGVEIGDEVEIKE